MEAHAPKRYSGVSDTTQKGETKMKQETKARIRVVGRILFLVYLLALVYFLFFAESYGRSIWLVPGFEWIIGKLAGRVNIFSKVFGSLTYDRKLSFPEEVGEYEVVDFLESIKKSKESL